MPEFSNSIITVAGRQLISQAIAKSVSIQFLRLELGQGAAPENPENLTALIQKQLEIPVSFVSPSASESCVITGMFKVNTILTGFYAREIGVFAKINNGSEVLFAYSNSGDKADYVPAGNASSLIECVYNLTIFVGSASVVIQDFDPNVVATKGYIDKKIDEVNIDKVNEDIKKAKEDLEAIKKDLGEASEGFVKKAGDTMTGDLTVNRVVGSSDMWNGWSICSGFNELNALNTGSSVGGGSPVIDIFAKMNTNSRFIADISEANDSLPGIGTIDCEKKLDGIVEAGFMDVLGRQWRGVFRKDVWSGWFEIASIPVGTAHEFYGSMDKPPPLGYVFMVGQLLPRAEYHRLFSVIGTTHGFTDETNFRVPDRRGVVARGLDSGRGLDSDPNRALGSFQGDAMRNIKETISGLDVHYLVPKEGAFSVRDSTWQDVFQYQPGGNKYRSKCIDIDFSKANIPVSSEFRVKNIAANFIMKI